VSGRSSKLPSLEVSLPAVKSPRRAGSGGLQLSRLPPRSPSVASEFSPRGSPCSSAHGGRQVEVEDDDLDDQLEELAELSQHLARRGEPLSEGPASSSPPASRGMAEHRPATGGTSASSTTAPGSSLATGEAATSVDWDESGMDAVPEGHMISSTEDPWDSLRGAQRAHHEINQLRLPHGCRIEISHGSSAQFFLILDVAEGPYTPASLKFWVKVFSEYPAPGSFSVRCTQRIFHPSVDASTSSVDIRGGGYAEGGAVQLSGLIGAIIQLVKTPADSPAINAEAAMLLQTDPDEFRRTVRNTLNGSEHGGVRFDRVLSSSKVGSTKPAAAQPPRAMSENLQLELMKLEAMKDQFKAESFAFEQLNTDMLRELELF